MQKSQMARLPRSGASFSSLYEYETTLNDVISSLGFRPLSDEDESYMRCKMGRAIGLWSMMEGEYKATGAKLNIEDIERTLKGLIARLDQVHDILAATEEGIHHIHFIEVIVQITSALSENPEIGSLKQAQDFLADFRSRTWTVAHGASVALWLLNTLPKPSAGRTLQLWHDDFTRAVTRVCALNSVRTTISTDPVTRRVSGRFLETAGALERLLDPRMCAPSVQALAGRLEASKKRIKAG